MKYSLSFMDIEGMSDTIYFDSLIALSNHLGDMPTDFILTATIKKIRTSS